MSFSLEIRIGNRFVGYDQPAYVIAEAGVNHNGEMSRALELIDVAHAAGADAVKFQSFKSEALILRSVDRADYQKSSGPNTRSQFEMLKQLELSIDQMSRLKEHADRLGITFITTPFDESSLEELDSLDLDAIKIASTDLTNVAFVRRIASKGKPVILSSGMSHLDEVAHVVGALAGINTDVVLLQCTGTYPTPQGEVNLAVMQTYRRQFDMLVGFSDHTDGIGAGPYAIALGACVLEKHLTIDKSLPGPDHQASLNPEEFGALVREVRTVEAYIGNPRKEPTRSEANTRKMLQKCLVAAGPIALGEVFSEKNVIAKRTGGIGLSPLRLNDLVGQKARRSYNRDDIIEWP